MTVRKIIKWIGRILAILFAIALLVFGWFSYVTQYKIADIDSSVSADGRYALAFQSVGEPDFPFGDSHARLVLKADGKALIKYKFDVANDGAILCPDNWRVSWEEDRAEVTVFGEEQEDALYILYFDGSAAQEPPAD